jgi:hypothetical protein
MAGRSPSFTRVRGGAATAGRMVGDAVGGFIADRILVRTNILTLARKLLVVPALPAAVFPASPTPMQKLTSSVMPALFRKSDGSERLPFTLRGN